MFEDFHKEDQISFYFHFGSVVTSHESYRIACSVFALQVCLHATLVAVSPRPRNQQKAKDTDIAYMWLHYQSASGMRCREE